MYGYKNVFRKFVEASCDHKHGMCHPRDLIKSNRIWLFNPFILCAPIYNKTELMDLMCLAVTHISIRKDVPGHTNPSENL